MARHHLACAVSEVASFTVSFTSLSKFDIICLIKWDKLGTRCSSEIKAEPDYFYYLFWVFLGGFLFCFLEETRKEKGQTLLFTQTGDVFGFREPESPKSRNWNSPPEKLCRPVETERGDGSECKHYVPFHTSDPHRCCLTLDSSVGVIFFGVAATRKDSLSQRLLAGL